MPPSVPWRLSHGPPWFSPSMGTTGYCSSHTSGWVGGYSVMVCSSLGTHPRGRAGRRYLADHLLELEVERRAAARHALWHKRLQVPGQDARAEQTVAHEVHKLGELCVGELERRLEQRVETRQYWLDRAQRSLQVWRKITRCVMARRGRGVQMVADGVCEVDKGAVMYERRQFTRRRQRETLKTEA